MDENLRILILEDRLSDVYLIEFELQEEGIAFISQWAETERDYVRALQEFSPDLILSDYDLPQYTGSLALVAAKKLCPEVPFILVTGAISDDDGLLSEILAQGARECVPKNHLERLAPAVMKVTRANGGKGNAAGKRES
jgi:CheY-like chemotaxis protein